MLQLYLKSVSELYKDEKLPLYHPSIDSFLGWGILRASAKPQQWKVQQCSNQSTTGAAKIHSKGKQEN